jgi:hypothetical protein
MVTSLKLADVIADALGLSGQTVVQHVKNLQAEELLTSAGRGRGAAHMRPLDAARLLLAAAGSDLVKDSVLTVETFGGLLPIGHSKRPGPHIVLEDHLAGLLTDIAVRAHARTGDDEDERSTYHSLSSAYLSLSLLSAVSRERGRFPCVAVARRVLGRGVGAISFATAAWDTPEISPGDYAAAFKESGLILQRHVTVGAMEKIALSL